MDDHPPGGKEVHSAKELASLVASGEPECHQTYRIHNPLIAEIHRIRARLINEQKTSGLILNEDPPRGKK